MDQGAKVIDIGRVSTPLAYFSMFTGKYSAGIMITASHLPKQYNGFKLMDKNGYPIFWENGGKDILEIIKADNYPSSKQKGIKKKQEWHKQYKKYLSDLLSDKKFKEQFKDLKVIIDQSNGVGEVEVEVLKSVLPKAKILNFKVSGNFPGHEPDPLNPVVKKKTAMEIKKAKADLGIVFDADADRVCFFDEKGNFIRPDVILSMLITELRRGKVVYDTRSSKAVSEIAQKQGVQAVMSKSGRAYMIEAMKNEMAEIGAENSGHFFFKDYKYLDCAGVAAAKVLVKFAQTRMKEPNKKFSEFVSGYDIYFHSGEINFKVKNPSKAFLIVEQGFTDARKTLFIDGLSVYYDNYWFNVRKSNTEALVRVNAEANTKEELDNIIRKLTKIMNLTK
mgnify:CR=1 FL=1